jgi:DNA-binding NtrC family response regulator
LGDSPSILVVEDEVLLLLILESALEEGGFKVIVASSAEKAIQMLAQKSALRAVVTDVNLGKDKSGWDVAKHAREIDPEIAVIYLTGHGENDWASYGVPKSVLLTKPFALDDLLTAVSYLLNDSSQQG